MLRSRARLSLLVLVTACARGHVDPGPAQVDPGPAPVDPEPAPAKTAAEPAEAGEAGETGEVIGLGQIGTGLHAPTLTPTIALRDAEADLEVRGEVDRAAVWRELQAHRAEVETCCRDLHARRPSTGGEAKITFVIGKRGEVMLLNVAELELGGASSSDGVTILGSCLRRASAAWAFPAPRSGVATVVYRVGFTPAP